MSAPRLLEDVKQALKARFAIKSNYRDESWQTLECEREFKRYDLDGSGHLGREEFGAALEGLNIFDRTQHKLLFDAFDFDGSGFISIREFSNMLYAPAVASPQDNAKTQVLMERLREGIAEHGGENGMNQLRNLFSRLDADSSGSLSGDELKIALRAFGIQVSNSDLALLVNAFDVDHDGTITVAEFLRGVRGKMSSRRVDLVTKVFNAVDRMKQGYLTVEDIEIAFNPSVLGGDFSHKQALAIINQLLDPDSKGSISLEDFLNYYRDLSVCIADNERFANKLKAAWLPAASINSSFLSTSAAPRPASRSGSNASTPQRRLSNLGSALGRSSPIATKLSRPVSGSATPNKAANPLSNNWIDEAEEKTSVETSSPSKKAQGRAAGKTLSDGSPRKWHQSSVFNYSRPVTPVHPGKRGPLDGKGHGSLSAENPFAVTQSQAAESGGNQPLLSPKGKRNFACDNKTTLNPIGMFAESDADADTFHTLKVRGRKNSLEQPWNRQNINASNDSPMVDVVGGGAANKLKAEKRAKDLSASMRAVNDGDTDSANWSESKSPVKWSGSAKQSSQRGSGTAAPVAGGVKTHSVRSPEDSKLLEQISDMIMSRSGKAGIESLGRFFIRSDRNKDGLLGRVELQDTMAVFGIRLTLQEVDRILACIDRDGSGQVTYSELLRELRGVLNPRRLDLVKLAFTRFDKSGDGQVDFQDLVNVFDASKHPDVKSGKISEKAAFDQFLANFELYGDKDGVITLDEFVEYYRWVSSNIDKDDYFELMIRNAWHIPGGKGQFENTANLRVLVTFIDGTQQVIGIDDDLGMGSNPSQSVLKARLRKQGVVNIQKVTIHD